jgi:hypothetical protein
LWPPDSSKGGSNSSSGSSSDVTFTRHKPCNTTGSVAWISSATLWPPAATAAAAEQCFEAAMSY